MLVVSRARSSSASATTATTYGGGNEGSQVWWLMLNPTTTAFPEVGASDTARPRQEGHTGIGGWKYRPQSPHREILSTPSAPDRQNPALPSVGCGRGRTGAGRAMSCSFGCRNRDTE
jgi:hypothetical protein